MDGLGETKESQESHRRHQGCKGEEVTGQREEGATWSIARHIPIHDDTGFH